MTHELNSAEHRRRAAETTEYLVSTLPVIVRRSVLWSECDPARVVFTGRFFDYAAACYGWFLRHVVHTAGDGKFVEMKLGTPMRAISLEFERMLKPGDWFEMRLRVTGIRNRTFEIQITATGPANEAIFVARLTPIIIADDTKQSVAIPDFLRIALERHAQLPD